MSVGKIYDWTEYKEEGNGLNIHGINFFFSDGKLEAIGKDTLDSNGKLLKETVSEAENFYGEMRENNLWDIWDGFTYDIYLYVSDEGDMVGQRIINW